MLATCLNFQVSPSRLRQITLTKAEKTMSGKFGAKAAIILLLSLILAACGGSENSSKLSGLPNDSDQQEPPTSAQPTIGSISLLASQPQIGTGGENQATISAIVTDTNSALMPDVDVVFSSGGLGVLSDSVVTTSSSGVATVTLTSLGDARNRTITVTATAGSKSESVNVSAAGTTLTISGPTAISLGDNATYTISLLDSDDRGVSGETLLVDADGNASTGNVITDASGSAVVTVTANTGGTATLRATAFSGTPYAISSELEFEVSDDSFSFTSPAPLSEIPLNTNQDITVSWTVDGSPVADGEVIEFSTTRGTFQSTGTSVAQATTSSGTATVSISSLDTGIAEITASPSSDDITTTLKTEFVATTPSSLKLNATRTQLIPGESSDITAVVKDASGNLVKNVDVVFSLSDVTGGSISRGTDSTNSQGIARTTYTASDSSSEKDDVIITARIDTQPTPIEEQINLTVGGQALTIVIGTGNSLKTDGDTFYNQPWGVLVTDANGNAAANQEVEISVLPAEYRKGIYIDTDPDPEKYRWAPQYSATCIPENAEPAGPDRWIANPASAPRTIITDAAGKAEFNINYSESQCSWAKVKLTATARVQGEESQSSQSFVLPCLAEDITSSAPPGTSGTSFYGATADCSTTD